MPGSFGPSPAGPRNVDAGEAFDVAVHLEFSPRKARSPAPVLDAPIREIVEQREIVDQVEVVARGLLDRDALRRIVSEDGSRTESLNGRQCFSGVGSHDLLAGTPVHVM